MKKNLLIAITLLLQVPVHAGVLGDLGNTLSVLVYGSEYDQWRAQGGYQQNQHMAPLSVDQRREIFAPKLEDFSRQVARIEAAALRSAPGAENTWFPKDVEGLYFDLRNFKDSYWNLVVQPYGTYSWIFNKADIERFMEEYDASKRDQLFMYPAIKAVHLMLRLHKAYGVKAHF